MKPQKETLRIDERSYFLTRLPVHEKAADWASGAQATQHVTPHGSDELPNKTTQETAQEKILRLLRDRPQSTRLEPASELGPTSDGVKYHRAKLRKAGRIRHTGTTKASRWEVLE